MGMFSELGLGVMGSDMTTSVSGGLELERSVCMQQSNKEESILAPRQQVSKASRAQSGRITETKTSDRAKRDA